MENIKQFCEEFLREISSAKKILISSHKNPDDDSISAVLSTRAVLLQLDPSLQVDVAYSGPISQRWHKLPDFNKIQSHNDISEIVSEYDTVIFLDGGQFHRFSSNPETIEAANIKTICIDHHASPLEKFTLSIAVPSATSTAELLYRIFTELQFTLTPDLSQQILLGILGDTGNCRFIRPDQADVFDIIKALVTNGGIDIQTFKSRFDQFSVDTFKIIQIFARNTVIHKESTWPGFLTSFVPAKTLERYSALDIREAAHIYISMFGLSVQKASWNMVVYPLLDGSVSISMRSLPGSVNARKLGEQLVEEGIFTSGGGHDRAGGGAIKRNELIEPEECLDIVQGWMANHSPII